MPLLLGLALLVTVVSVTVEEWRVGGADVAGGWRTARRGLAAIRRRQRAERQGQEEEGRQGWAERRRGARAARAARHARGRARGQGWCLQSICR